MLRPLPARIWFLLLAWLWLASLTSEAVRGEERSLLSIDDLYRLDGPTSAVVLPDGESAIYVRRWHDPQTRQVRQSLWRVSGDASQAAPLEEGEPDAREPRLSPDGKWLAFLSSRPLPDGSPPYSPVPRYSDPPAEIWLIGTLGGKAVPLGGKDRPYDRVFTDPFYGNVAFSPDGRRLTFVADDGRDPRTPEEIANEVEIVRDDQGEGYEGYGPAQIWIADLADSPGERAARRITRITDDDVWYGDPQWWPDGQSLVVHANRSDDRESVRYSINKNFDLYRIHLGSTGEPRPGERPSDELRANGHRLQALTSGPGPEVSPRISPDGRKIVCLSIPRRGSHFDVFNLVTIHIGSGGGQSRVLFDHHGPEADKPPHLPPSFPLPRECWLNDDTFYYDAFFRTGSRRQVIDLRQGAKADDEERPELLSERLATESAARRKLIPAGNSFLRERRVAREEAVRWSSFDGREIEGVFTYPADSAAKAPYPVIVYPHGGPHSRSTVGFNFNVQIFAAHGYAVFQPNYRGSAGYGQEFLEADRFDLGGGDMRDILTGIDRLIDAGLVDRRRQFIYGSSYGGFTTCRLIGQTRQFRAAAPQNAVTDLNAMWGLSDLQSWTEWEFGGRPWETPQAMREHSPLTHVANVRTPTLILHAANDRRVPLPMGRMFYRALRANGVETKMVIYPGEGHPIKQLHHQEDLLRRVLAWFAKHDLPEAERSASNP